MKKISLTLIAVFAVAVMAFAQKTNAELAAAANPAIDAARQATIRLSEYYGLHDEQVTAVLQIQQEKMAHLQEIVAIKATDFNTYNLKRDGIIDQAEIALYDVLEAEQKPRYVTRQNQRAALKSNQISVWVKEGKNSSEIDRMLAEMEF